MFESIRCNIKKSCSHLGLAIIAIAVVASSLTGCSKGKSDEEVIKGKSDEEVIGEIAEKFLLAMYTQNEALAKEICNDTAFESFKSKSDWTIKEAIKLALGEDEAAIISKINVVRVKMISKNKGVATVHSSVLDFLDEPSIGEYGIPAEKDDKGNWKISVKKGFKYP